MFPGNVNLN